MTYVKRLSTDFYRAEPIELRLLRNKEIIMKEWENCLRKEVPSASIQTSTALRNGLPKYLEEIADCLKRQGRPNECGTQEVAKEHGAQRTDLHCYTLDQVLYEYRVLRRVIMDSLRRYGPVNEHDSDIIVDFIQFGMAQAAHEFAEKTKIEERISFADLKTEREMRERFVSTLTHDLRNPLSAIKTSAQIIQNRPILPERAQALASRIISSVDRADNMIQDLLDANRIRVGQKLSVQFEPTNISQIIRDAINESAAIHGSRFLLDIPGEIVGYWSGKELRRALDNLLNNGIKYGNSRPISVGVHETNEGITIQVHNWGHPISADDQKNLFQQFRRLSSAENSRTQGWGLGLTIVRGVADVHGGTVDVNSSLEAGTTFSLKLPRDSRMT